MAHTQSHGQEADCMLPKSQRVSPENRRPGFHASAIPLGPLAYFNRPSGSAKKHRG